MILGRGIGGKEKKCNGKKKWRERDSLRRDRRKRGE